MRDTAKHYNPKLHVYLEAGILAPLLSIGALASLWFYCVRKKKKEALQRERSAIALVILDADGEDGLPKYKRIGKLGEVPPDYSARTLMEEVGDTETPVEEERRTSEQVPVEDRDTTGRLLPVYERHADEQ